DFFDNDPLVIDLSPLNVEGASSAELDFDGLSTLLRSYRMQPLAVRGGAEPQMAAALASGLIAAQDALVQRSQPSQSEADNAAEPAQAAHVAPSSAVEVPLGALVIDKPLRSGQQVYAR